jgi:DNA polymerase-3 subunit alpha
MYVSDHPISPYLPLIRQKATHATKELAEAADKQKVTVAGMVTRIRTTVTKKGEQMAFANIEDLQGSVELVIFPRAWERMGGLVKMESVILVEGKVDLAQSEPKILVDVIKPLREEDIPAYEEPASDLPGQGVEETWQTDIDTMRYIHQENGYEEPPLSDEESSWKTLPPTAVNPAEHETVEHNPVIEPAGNTEEALHNPLDTEENHDTGNSSNDPPSRAFIKPPAIVSPLLKMDTLGERGELRLVTVTIKSSGEKERDVRRIRLVHGVLNSFPGRDRFCFMLYEHGFRHLMDFPNDTTNASKELVEQLAELVGRENVHIENL